MKKGMRKIKSKQYKTSIPVFSEIYRTIFLVHEFQESKLTNTVPFHFAQLANEQGETSSIN